MQFQISCQTLPWSEFTFERALEGVARAGYEYMDVGAWHAGDTFPSLESGAAGAAELRKVINRFDLKPQMIFGLVNVLQENGIEQYKLRVDQAKAMGAPYIISMGTSSYSKFPDEKKSDEERASIDAEFVEKIKPVGQYALEQGVTILLKPHTGNTETGARCAETMAAIDCEAIRTCYDAGNVKFYEGVDPHEDIKNCLDSLAALCIKDHRGERANPVFPCPGEGDVDHVRLLRSLKDLDGLCPLSVERFEGGRVKKEMSAELIDEIAQKAKEHLEWVVGELQ